MITLPQPPVHILGTHCGLPTSLSPAYANPTVNPRPSTSASHALHRPELPSCSIPTASTLVVNIFHRPYYTDYTFL
jgi:hypothetical protein